MFFEEVYMFFMDYVLTYIRIYQQQKIILQSCKCLRKAVEAGIANLKKNKTEGRKINFFTTNERQ